MRLLEVGFMLAPTLAFASCSVADGSAARGVEYLPSREVARAASLPLEGEGIGLIRDFDLSGDTMFLLDASGHVLVAERQDTMWLLIDSFGGSGGGPGEFLTATGVAVAGASVGVIDNTRLQFFSRGGEHTSFRLLQLPCSMLRAGVAQSHSGVFVHGNCTRSAFTTDTMKSVLAWSPDTTTWHIVAEDLRYTRDGSAGNLFTASSALTPGSDGVHLFGSGARDCVWLIADSLIPPTATQRCPVARILYSADPPPGLRQRLRSGAVGGVPFEWPATLPAYVERIGLNGRILLIRPYSADSVVVQEAAPSSRDIAVAPLNGLIGCKAAGCLWVLEDAAKPRVIVLDTAMLGRGLRIPVR